MPWLATCVHAAARWPGAPAWSVTITAIEPPPHRVPPRLDRALADQQRSTDEPPRVASVAASVVDGNLKQALQDARRTMIDRSRAHGIRVGRFSVLREVRRITGMDLAEAREALAQLPLVVATTGDAGTAQVLVNSLERAGAVVSAVHVGGADMRADGTG